MEILKGKGKQFTSYCNFISYFYEAKMPNEFSSEYNKTTIVVFTCITHWQSLFWSHLNFSDYHSNPNPNGFASGPPMSLPPSNAMLNQSAASLHQQSGYYWENHGTTFLDLLWFAVFSADYSAPAFTDLSHAEPRYERRIWWRLGYCASTKSAVSRSAQFSSGIILWYGWIFRLQFLLWKKNIVWHLFSRLQ